MASSMEILIACAKAPLDSSWVGKQITAAIIPEMKDLGIDLTGGKGKYHSIVLNR